MDRLVSIFGDTPENREHARRSLEACDNNVNDAANLFIGTSASKESSPNSDDEDVILQYQSSSAEGSSSCSRASSGNAFTN